MEDVIFGDITSGVDIFGDPIEGGVELVVETLDTNKKDKEEIVETDEILKDKETPVLLDEEEEEKPKKGKNYLELAKTLVEVGEWEDFELEEGVEELTEEDFKALKKEQTKLKKEKTLEALDPDEKEFLDFKKKGGNIETYIQTLSLKNQAQNLDIETEEGKKTAIYAYYKNVVGWSDEKVLKHIGRVIEDLELDDEAEMAKGKIEEITAKQHQDLIERQNKIIEERENAKKAYKDGVNSKLKEKGVEKTLATKIVKAYTEEDDKGFTEIDRKYLELRNNPDLAEELYFFMTDINTYKEKIATKKANEEKLDTFKNIKFIKPQKQEKKKEEEVEDGIFI